MMKWIKAAFKYLLLALMIWCLGHAFSLSSTLTDDRPPVIYYLDDGMTLNQLKEMKDSEDALDDAVSFSSYGRMENQSFSNPELGRTMTGPALLLFGDSSLIFHSTGELFADDDAGCLLSSEAAWQLFGETFVSQGTISWQGKEYIVRGIFKDEKAQVVVKAPEKEIGPSADLNEEGAFDEETPVDVSENNEVSFSRILIRPDSDSAKRMEIIHAFENRHGFGESKTDCSVYVRLGICLVFLIPAIIFFIYLWLAVSSLIALRFRPFWFVIGAAAAVAAFILFFVICQARPSVPADLIPNRWSDFNFWGEKITTLVDSIRHMLFAEKTEVELTFFRPVTDIAGYTVVSVILFFAAFTAFSKALSDGHLLIMLCLSVLVEGFVIFLQLRAGLMMPHLRILICLWPLILAILCIFRKNGLLAPKDVDTER